MKTTKFLLFALLALALVYAGSSSEHSNSEHSGSEHSGSGSGSESGSGSSSDSEPSCVQDPSAAFPGICTEQSPLESGVFSYSLLPGVHRHIVSQNPYESVLNTGETWPGNIGFLGQGQQRFQPEREQTVFVCHSEEEIEEVLENLPAGVTVSVRGGGHDFNNASLLGDVIIILADDFVTDSGVDIVEVRQTDKGERVVVNPKARLANIYKTLYDINPQFNSFAGTCPSVGISGFALGGGHGLLTPWYGLATHYLESVRFVDASGEAYDVDDESHPDLMKTLRGGGHNLGVVTEMTFDLTTIPKHNWNYVQYLSEDITPERYIYIWRQYEKLVKSQRYETARLRFRRGAGGKITSDLLFFAPSHIVSLEEFKQTAEEYFPEDVTGYQVFPNSEIENKPWFELYMQDIPVKGSIGNEMFYPNIASGADYQLNIHNGNIIANGVKENLEDIVNETYLKNIISTSINNYQYKQTGPFAEKSMFLPYSDISKTDIAFTLWTMGFRATNDVFLNIFEDSGLYYVNYFPSDTSFTNKDFFGDDSEFYQKVKAQVDPNQRFVDKYDSSNYSNESAPRN